MGVEVFSVCDYDRVIFNYFFFYLDLFHGFSLVCTSPKWIYGWTYGRGQNRRTAIFPFLKGDASVFIGRALHFSFCLITRACFKRIAMNTHIPPAQFCSSERVIIKS